MGEIDNILASTFSKFIIKNLSQVILKEIKDEVMDNYKHEVDRKLYDYTEEYEYAVFEYVVANFEKMENVLSNVFGPHAYPGVISELLKQICLLEDENNEKNDFEKQYRITINDDDLATKIVFTINDPIKNKILEITSPAITTHEIIKYVNNNDLNDISVLEIIKKIDELVDDKFLVISQDDENKEPKYSSALYGYDININEQRKVIALIRPMTNSDRLLQYILN